MSQLNISKIAADVDRRIKEGKPIGYEDPSTSLLSQFHDDSTQDPYIHDKHGRYERAAERVRLQYGKTDDYLIKAAIIAENLGVLARQWSLAARELYEKFIVNAPPIVRSFLHAGILQPEVLEAIVSQETRNS